MLFGGIVIVLFVMGEPLLMVGSWVLVRCRNLLSIDVFYGLVDMLSSTWLCLNVRCHSLVLFVRSCMFLI